MDENLSAKIRDQVRRCEQKSIATHIGFLDPAQQAQANLVLNTLPGCRFLFSGGYGEAERKFLFFLPDYLDKDFFPLDEYILAYRATCPFNTPTHRDFLGSLLGLGIKRECVGDILVDATGAILILDAKIASFVLNNLEKIGRGGVTLSPLALSDIKPVEEPFREVTATVASTRLDAVASAAFGISRSITADAIRDGSISLNWLACTSPDTILQEADLISWRGHGRARLFSCGGLSKKGRQFISLHVYTK